MRYAMYMGLLAAYIITVDFVQVFNFCFLLYLSCTFGLLYQIKRMKKKRKKGKLYEQNLTTL